MPSEGINPLMPSMLNSFRLGTVVSSLIFQICFQIPVLSFSIDGRKAPRYAESSVVYNVEQKLKKLIQNIKSRSRLVTLSEAIEQSLLKNPRLGASYKKIQQNEWNLIAVRRQWYPNFEFAQNNSYNILSNGVRNYNKQIPFKTLKSTSTALPTQISNLNTLTPSIKLSWTFFDPSRSPNINSSIEELRASELLFNVEARRIVLEAQLAFFVLQEQQQLIKNYQMILNSTSDQVAITTANFNAGNSDIAAVEQIRSQQLQNLNLLISTHNSLAIASATLAGIMSADPGAFVLAAGEIALVGEWKISLNETIMQAERMREEVQISLAQSSSLNWTATAIKNSYYPKFKIDVSGTYINLNTEYESGFPDRDTSIGSISSKEKPRSSERTTWDSRVALGFTWKIFDGGINTAQAQAKEYAAQELIEQAASNKLTIAKEVEIAYAGYESSKLALLTTGELVKSASNALLAVSARFNNGFSDMTSVVQATTRSIDASREHARSKRNYNDAVASLYRFSAQWPDEALPALSRRVQTLK